MPQSHMWVSWCWVNDELASFFAEIESIPPLSDETHTNLQLQCIIEVTERVLSVSAIGTTNVKDIAFVLHADMFESEFLDCAGMEKFSLLDINILLNDTFNTASLPLLNSIFHCFGRVKVPSTLVFTTHMMLDAKAAKLLAHRL